MNEWESGHWYDEAIGLISLYEVSHLFYLGWCSPRKNAGIMFAMVDGHAITAFRVLDGHGYVNVNLLTRKYLDQDFNEMADCQDFHATFIQLILSSVDPLEMLANVT